MSWHFVDVPGALSTTPIYIRPGGYIDCFIHGMWLLQGASSMVGITSIDEGIKAHAAGADALLLKREMLAASQDVQRLLEQLKYTTSGDY